MLPTLLNRTSYLFIVCSILSVSCFDSSEPKDSYRNSVRTATNEVSYQVHRSIQLPTDSNQYVYYTSNVSRIDNNDYFYGVDDTEELLHVYDIGRQKRILKIDLSFDPEANLGEVAESFIHNFDSIFLLSPYEGLISLVDSSSTLINQWNISREITNSDLLSLESGENGNHFSYMKKRKELVVYGYGEYNPFKDWEYYQQPFKCFINLETYSVKTFGQYPEVYLDKEKGVPGIDEETFTTIAGENVYMSFPRSTEIQMLSTTDSLTVYYGVGSLFFSKTNTYNRTENYDILMRSFITEPYFLNLLWDDVNSLFYRVAKLSSDYRMPNGEVSLQTDSKWSVIICDKNMNVLGESMIDSKKYNFNYTFITKDGLMISKDSPSNPADNENIIEFDILHFNL